MPVSVAGKPGHALRLIARGLWGALMLVAAGCESKIHRSEYVWGGYPVHDNTLYVIKRSSVLETDARPIPERAEPRLVSVKDEVIAVDLTGLAPIRSVAGVKRTAAARSNTRQDNYLIVDAVGGVQLRDRASQKQRLRNAGGITCDGHVQEDEQDSRVFYYVCDSAMQAYRFDPPYRQPCLIRLGAAGGMGDVDSAEYRFASVAGEPLTFVSVGWGWLYEVSACDAVARVVDRYAPPDRAFEVSTAPTKPPRWSDVQRLRHRLIGMGSGLRIYQVGPSHPDAELWMVREGHAPERMLLPSGLGSGHDVAIGTYRPQSARVFWHQLDVSGSASEIHMYDLVRRRFTKVTVPRP